MRFIYVDEAGTSAKEPVAVVTGLIIHADSQWMALERHRNDVIEKFIPEQDRPGFIFHAKDLFSGGGYFDRRRWPLQHRLVILRSLLRAVPWLKIPPAYGAVRKTPEHLLAIGDEKRYSHTRYEIAYVNCITVADIFMRSFADDNEIALVVAEDSEEKKARLRSVHHAFQHETHHQSFPEVVPRRLMPIRRIVETVHFAEKPHAPLLQFADACAFTLRRYMAGYKYAEDLIAELSPKDALERLRETQRPMERGLLVWGGSPESWDRYRAQWELTG